MSWFSWLMPYLIVWMLNGVVMAAVLAKLFVFGEPVTKPLTASSVSYWRSRRQADVYLTTVSCRTFSASFSLSVYVLSVCLTNTGSTGVRTIPVLVIGYWLILASIAVGRYCFQYSHAILSQSL